MTEQHHFLRTLGQRIRSLRQAIGWTQEELAHAAAIDRAYLSDVEHGRHNVGVAYLPRIAKVLRVPVSDFFQADSPVSRRSGGWQCRTAEGWGYPELPLCIVWRPSRGVTSAVTAMTGLLVVARASALEGSPRRRLASLWFCALLVTCLLGAYSSVSAQDRPRVDTEGPSRQEPATAQTSSVISLDRIRLALTTGRLIDLPDGTALDFQGGPLAVQRSALELFGGLDVTGGVGLFVTAGARPITAAPTHQEMLRVMTPRDHTEVASADALGIATASAFTLVPAAIKAIAGWLSDTGEGDGSERRILPDSLQALALTLMRANPRVLDAGIGQRERTVALSLVVPPDTPPGTARVLGERFVVLVKAFASAEPREIGADDYDYTVRVSSPAEAMIAFGGQAIGHRSLNW